MKAPKELTALVGATIVEVVVQPSADYLMVRPDLFLIVVKGDKKYSVHAAADEEGNGPGWLHVAKV